MTRSVLAALTIALLALPVAALGKIQQGTVVRIQAGSIEGGWHRGRMVLDDQKCWMVKLDQATREQYTMLALIVVDQMQVAKDGTWSAVGLKPLLAAQPALCGEYAND